MVYRGVDPGGGGGGGAGGGSCPHENIGVANISFCPSPNNFDNLKTITILNAIIGLKSTVRHYTKLVNLTLKILRNIQNFQFCGALCA